MRNGVYLLTGEDEFRKRLSLVRLKEKLLGQKADTFNYDSYYGKESSAEEIIRSLETLPMSGGRKLIVLKEPELLPAEDKAKLAVYLKDPRSNSAVLVLLSKKFPDRNDKLSSAVSGYAKVIDFAKLHPDEASAWIVEEFKARNKLISRRQAESICEAARGDLGRISNIIEQVSIFVSDRDRIADDDIAQFIDQGSAEVSAFKFLDYINDRDARNSLRVLKGLLRSENNPSQIVGLLSWHITRLIAIKRFMINKVPKDKMLSYFSMGSYTLDKLISQAQDVTLKKLKGHLDTLLDADLMLKRSGIKAEILLELLVVRLSM